MDKSGSNIKPDVESINGSVVVGVSSPAQLGDNKVLPTYGQLLEEDLVKKPPRNNKIDNSVKMGKSNGSTDAGDVDDGAKERMLKDDVRLTILPSKKDSTEVKFLPENGDAKIDIGSVKKSLSGLTKSELMKYANDPFWKRLRWLLFFLFWVVWLTMLVGAVAIIITAPKKCTIVWKESLIARIDAANPPTSLRDMELQLKELQNLNFRAVSLNSILKGTVDGSVEDFMNIDPKVGQLGDFIKFTKSANSKGIHVYLELSPNHSSDKHPWFLSSINRTEPYTSYYMWDDKARNNWKSTNNNSAWTFKKDRNQFYYHQFEESQPDLNYTNTEVKEEFKNFLKFWIDQGVKGFRLNNTNYLVEDPSFANDQKDNDNPGDSYESLQHDHTKDTIHSHQVLKDWRDSIKTDPEILFASSDEISPATEEANLLDLPKRIKTLSNIDFSVSAVELNNTFVQLQKPWSSVYLDFKEDLKSKKPEVAESLMLLTLLFPATPILRMKDISHYKNNTAFTEVFSNVSVIRKSPSFLEGETKTYVLSGTNESCKDCIFAYTRIKADNPSYLVVYNSHSNNTNVSVRELPSMPKEVTIVTHSSNYSKKNVNNSKKLSTDMIPMDSKSLLILKFTPDKDA